MGCRLHGLLKGVLSENGSSFSFVPSCATTQSLSTFPVQFFDDFKKIERIERSERQMSDHKNYFVHIDGQLVPVTEEVYLAYYRFKCRMRYFENDLKIGSPLRDQNGNITGYKFAKEDSLDRLSEAGEDYAEDSESVEDAVIRAVMSEILRETLRKLPDNDRQLIDALFFSNDGNGMTEREYAKITGISQQSVNERKRRILGKLLKLIEK